MSDEVFKAVFAERKPAGALCPELLRAKRWRRMAVTLGLASFVLCFVGTALAFCAFRR